MPSAPQRGGTGHRAAAGPPRRLAPPGHLPGGGSRVPDAGRRPPTAVYAPSAIRSNGAAQAVDPAGGYRVALPGAPVDKGAPSVHVP
ncbi:hypothetical protein [Streptomyces sp. NPDC058674]|uniref:hypothetical protein n=1 Tax=Streptomyces sp. NPDC058674 TaxID=3346592 RepID=UPI0036656CAD